MGNADINAWVPPEATPSVGAAPDDADDFRRSALEAHRARRKARSWSDELETKIARLERRMAAFANGSQGVDSPARNPRKESS